jgi:hypothetical protein
LDVSQNATIDSLLSVAKNTQTGIVQTKPTVTTAGYVGSGSIIADQWGLQNSTTAGFIYAWQGNWNAAAQANNGSTTASDLLGVSLDGAAGKAILLRGLVNLGFNISGNAGDILYLNDSFAGRCSTTIPSGTGEIVRIVGYIVDASTELIYFCPDNTFVKL